MSRAPIRVGVAGWDYRDWKGVVYPEKRPKGSIRSATWRSSST